MSHDIIAESVVKRPDDKKPRRGRGFSKEEIKLAGITINDARDLGLIVDLRRRTTHQENVAILKQYVKDVEAIAEEILETAIAEASPDKAIEELSSLKSVTKSEAKLLAESGIASVEDLAYCEIAKVGNKTGIAEDRITAMVKEALKKV